MTKGKYPIITKDPEKTYAAAGLCFECGRRIGDPECCDSILMLAEAAQIAREMPDRVHLACHILDEDDWLDWMQTREDNITAGYPA